MRPISACDVVDVEAGADDPAPGLEALDVRLLRLEPLLVVEPLPDVVDVAFAFGLHQVGELDEDGHPARVGETREVAAVEVGAIRVHDHRGRGVLDPVVVEPVLAIAQLGDDTGCGGLGFLACEQAGPLVGLVRCQHAPGRVRQLPDHLALAVDERPFERRQDQPPEGDEEEGQRSDRGHDDAEDERPTTEVSGAVGGIGRSRNSRLAVERRRAFGETRSLEHRRPEADPVLVGDLDPEGLAAEPFDRVVVGAGADEKVVRAGKLPQRLTLVQLELLVDGLDAVEPLRTQLQDKLLQAAEIAVVDERMGQEDGAPGAMQQRDGVADLKPAIGGGGVGLMVHGAVAGRPQRAFDAVRIGRAVRLHRGQRGHELRVHWVEAVGEEVDDPVLVLRRQLDPRQRRHASSVERVAEGRPACHRVVITERGIADTRQGQPLTEDSRRQRPVTVERVRVQIDEDALGHGPERQAQGRGSERLGPHGPTSRDRHRGGLDEQLGHADLSHGRAAQVEVASSAVG